MSKNDNQGHWTSALSTSCMMLSDDGDMAALKMLLNISLSVTPYWAGSIVANRERRTITKPRAKDSFTIARDYPKVLWRLWSILRLFLDIKLSIRSSFWNVSTHLFLVAFTQDDDANQFDLLTFSATWSINIFLPLEITAKIAIPLFAAYNHFVKKQQALLLVFPLPLISILHCVPKYSPYHVVAVE